MTHITDDRKIGMTVMSEREGEEKKPKPFVELFTVICVRVKDAAQGDLI